MSSGNTSGPTLGERLIDVLDSLHDAYDDVESRVRTVTPYVVRTIEVVLAIGLLAALAHWLHWVYVVGV